MSKKILFWSVDCQRDFIDNTGKLSIKDAVDIRKQLAVITNSAKVQNITVVNTADWHTKEDPELSDKPDFINTFPEHCMAGTEGADFIEETDFHKYGREPYYISNTTDNSINTDELLKCRNVIIYKNKFDVFEGNRNTEEIVKAINPSSIIVYGVATNVCVNAAVIGLASRGYKVTVIGNAIKELPNIPIGNILENWYRLGITIKFL